MDKKYDVVILGAGTAGLSALGQVRRSGRSFLLIDPGPLGTTCARVGCMPSKSLVEIASAYRARSHMERSGIRGTGSLEVDGRKVMERVRTLRDLFMKNSVKAVEDLGNSYLRESAEFLEPGVLKAGSRRILADSVVVATGSTPVVPEPWRNAGEALLTSDTVFDLPDLPRRMAVVGLGPLGLEMAQAFAGLGVGVRGYDASRTVGALNDAVVSSKAVELLERGFPIDLGTEVRIEASGQGARVTAGGGGEEFDRVLAAVGRRPSIDGLALENLGVELDEHGMPPFDPSTLQVAGLRVYLAGDVNNRHPVLHEASDDGRIAGYNAVAGSPSAFVRKVRMGVVFTHPPIASVGVGPGMQGAVTGEYDYGDQGRAMMTDRNNGMVRIYASTSDGRVLGGSIVAPGGEHTAHLMAWAVQCGMTVFGMLQMPYYHPTLEEGLRSAARDAARKLTGREEGPAVPELPLAGTRP